MKKLQIKRILALVAAVCMLLVTVTSALPVAAADPTVVYEFNATTDWTGQKNGTVTIGTCSKGPAYTYIKFSKFGTIYIGDYDLTKAGSVVFDVTGAGKNWETDYPDAHAIQFCADFEGQRVVGESKMVATKGYGEEMFTQTVYLADGYNGPLYIRLNCGTGHEYCIANLKFYERTGDEPEDPSRRAHNRARCGSRGGCGVPIHPQGRVCGREVIQRYHWQNLQGPCIYVRQAQ